MSRDILILTPNGRRVKIHCTADTSILQILEDVCNKQGLQPNDYDLKHHRHILDLTTTIRFCNLPNKAFLELVEAEKKRLETNVTIALMLNDGDRLTGDFPTSTTLYDLIISMAPNILQTLQNPSISYMRQEVTGAQALKEKSLRQLGLITGRAILRLIDKTESMQANVSKVYRQTKTETTADEPIIIPKPGHAGEQSSQEECTPGPSHDYKNAHILDPKELIQKYKTKTENKMETDTPREYENMDIEDKIENEKIETLKDLNKEGKTRVSPAPVLTQEILERRLKIEDEVTFIGSHKAVAFMQPDGTEEEISDLPDDFYELTIEEVRKMYHELQQRRIELENTPMLTSSKKHEFTQKESVTKLEMYKNVVVRIQFPDNIILQGVFTPKNTLEDVQNFVKEFLHDQNKPFQIFTTPLKETLDPKISLIEAKFVPCVHMHFKWLEDNPEHLYLREDIYSKQTTSDAACILASKYRAPSRRKLENHQNDQNVSNNIPGSKKSKVPKWFKN